ncbi:MAG: class I SAM-dependent methyltransferase [Myxococcota bacterium]
MSQTIPVELGDVQETLLIPLLARAVETEKPNGMLSDPKAVEIVTALDYDFDKWRGSSQLAGACVRTLVFDAEVRRFLEAHPSGTVIEIGAGLNTRFERVDNGTAHFVDLDLPDSTALRRRFFDDTDRRTIVAGSILETDWHDTVASQPGPYCFVSEAVLIYLEAEAIYAALAVLKQRFPGSLLITDTTSSRLISRLKKSELIKHLPSDAWFRWAVDDPKTLEDHGLTVEAILSYADAPEELIPKMPLQYRLLMRYARWMIRLLVRGYNINRLRL